MSERGLAWSKTTTLESVVLLAASLLEADMTVHSKVFYRVKNSSQTFFSLFQSIYITLLWLRQQFEVTIFCNPCNPPICFENVIAVKQFCKHFVMSKTFIIMTFKWIGCQSEKDLRVSSLWQQRPYVACLRVDGRSSGAARLWVNCRKECVHFTLHFE